MTKPEIEKLADEYVVSNMKSFMEENLTYTDAFKAGYLKGIEKAIEICNKEIKQHETKTSCLEIAMYGQSKHIKEELEQLLSSEGEK